MNRSGRRRQPGLEYGLYLLGMQAINYGVDKIPPVTLIGVVSQALLYIGVIPVSWNSEDVCISAKKIIHHRDWRSFILSNFEHGSDMHLYYNMVSFILKGAFLEPMYGKVNFGILLAFITAGCSAMYVGLSWILMQCTTDYSYYTTCAIGFSAVLFALKVIVVCEEHDRLYDVGGMRVPSKFAVWAELILIHLLVPNASFVGHLGGILVGCLYCYFPIGTMIDNFIHFISGDPIIHEEAFYCRRRSIFVC